MEELSIWGQVTIIVVTAATGALGWVGRRLWDRYDEKRKTKEIEKNSWNYKLSSYRDISLLLKRILQDTGAVRVLLLKCTNGGDIPKIDSTLYSSIVLEEFDDSFGVSIYDEWQQRRIDKHYTEMLVELNSKGSVVLSVTDCPPETILGSLYLKSGITGSRIYKIASTPSKYFYLVANYTGKVDSGDPNSDYTYGLVIDSLQQIFKKYAFIE